MLFRSLAILDVIGEADSPTDTTPQPADSSFSPLDSEQIGVIGGADGLTAIITQPKA